MKTLLSRRAFVALACSAAGSACAGRVRRAATPASPASIPEERRTMDRIAESYVKLVLALGVHDEDYVDAFYGPAAWRDEARAAARPLDAISSQARALLDELRAAAPPAAADELTRLRHTYLERQLSSLHARAALLGGRRMTFDEESQALYDAVAPTHTEAEFAQALAELDRALPGSGSLAERYEVFRGRFAVPADRLDTVFQLALREGRRRTLAQVGLPDSESFRIEYVTGKPWGGYNWYQGRYASLIQVNTDLPAGIDRALDLACHEGYPGHHVYNALLEQHMVVERGFVEFTVYPLFSPQSLIAEGTANYGIEVAFPGPERAVFETTVLFPAAGLDPAQAESYYLVQGLMDRLSYAGNEAARRYLDGALDRDGTLRWLMTYSLSSVERARQRLRFFERYRSYVINYNLGKDLVKQYVEGRGGTPDAPDVRWREFTRLLASPRLPGGLRAGREG
jgi:hypothetical protein